MDLPGRVYDFGRFRLDTCERVLFCADEPVHLTLKAFAVLRVLVENAGHVVEKEALIRQVWHDAFVEDDNLTQAVCDLRRVLGESRDRHEYIRTVHRRGYRFIAAVSVENEESQTRKLKSTLRRPSDEGGEVHHLYMRGRHYWKKYTVDGLNKGIDYFRRAIRIDPDYCLAYTGLADCYYRLATINLPPAKVMSKAKAAVIKALRMDDTIAESHALLGLIRVFYDRDWPAAEGEFKRAIELDPDSPLPYKRYGWALGLTGRFDEGIREITKALDLDPQSPDLRTGLGIILHLARRYDEAIAQAQIALDADPEFFPARVLLGMAHIQQGRLTKAIGELERAASFADVPWALGYLGYAYGVSGRQRQALRALSELEKRSERVYVSSHALALIYAGLGRKERALEHIMKTCEERNEMMGFAGSPEFDSLRSTTPPN